MCISLSLYIYIYMYMYVCMYTYIYIYIYILTRIPRAGRPGAGQQRHERHDDGGGDCDDGPHSIYIYI